MQYLKLFLVFSLAVSVGCNPAKKLAKNPVAGLKSQIQEMIDMLEKEDYVNFIQSCAHPDDLENILGDERIEEMAESFAGKKAQLLLSTLLAALEEEPEFNDDKTRAVFNAESMDRALVLERVDQRWYIRN